MEAVEPKTEPTPVQDKPQGMSDVFARPGAPAPEPKAAEQPVVTPKATPETEKPAVVEPPKDPQKGILNGLQSERRKRQEAERHLEDARRRIAEYEGAPPTAPAAAPAPTNDKLENRMLTISEQSARSSHSDFQEKFDAFIAGAIGPDGTPTDLYRSVMDESDHPGEAAYQAGKMILIQRKYGTDMDGMIKAVQEETVKDLEEKIRARVTAELTGKVARKDLTPTDILAGGSAGSGGDQPQAPLGFGHLLARRRR